MKALLFVVALATSLSAQAWNNIGGRDQRANSMQFADRAAIKASELSQILANVHAVPNATKDSLAQVAQNFLALRDGINSGWTLQDTRTQSTMIIAGFDSFRTTLLENLGNKVPRRERKLYNSLINFGQLGLAVANLEDEIAWDAFIGVPMIVELDLMDCRGPSASVRGHVLTNFQLVSDDGVNATFRTSAQINAVCPKNNKSIATAFTATVTLPSNQTYYSSQGVLSNSSASYAQNRVAVSVSKLNGSAGQLYCRGNCVANIR